MNTNISDSCKADFLRKRRLLNHLPQFETALFLGLVIATLFTGSPKNLAVAAAHAG